MDKNKFLKKLGEIVNVLVVVYLLAVIGTVAVINPARQSVSVIEKRELAKKPEFSFQALKEGSYTRALSDFFADTFPLRDSLIMTASEIKDSMGFRLGGAKLYGGADEAQQQPEFEEIKLPEVILPPELSAPVDEGSESVSSEPQPQSQPQPQPDEKEKEEASAKPESEPEKQKPVQEGVRVGSIITCDGTGYTLFGGGPRNGEWYAKVMNAYGDILGDGVRVYNLVVPTAVEYNLPERYRGLTNSQRASLDHIKGFLTDKVEWVDIYDVMKEHKDEYIYFKTDHHWTALGAYYAYTEFAKVAGFDPISLDGLEKRTLNDFYGTLYSQTQDPMMLSHPDHVDYYIFPKMPKCHMYMRNAPTKPVFTTLYGEYAKAQDSYSVFLHADLPIFVMDTGLNNGRRIAVVKESYGNAFVPFLANNYEQVVVIDQRYLQNGLYSVLDRYDINELLFINNILAAHTSVRIEELSTLPQRSYTPPHQTIEPQPEQDETAESADNN